MSIAGFLGGSRARCRPARARVDRTGDRHRRLGHLAVQILAALTPARIVAVDVAADALHLAREVGAHDAVLASDTTLGELEGLIGARGGRAARCASPASDTER